PVGTIRNFSVLKDGSSAAGGMTVYERDQVIEESIKIMKFSYEITEGLSAPIDGKRTGAFKISFSYQNVNKALNNPNTYEKKIDQIYKVITDASSGELLTCYSDTENVVTKLLIWACDGVGGDSSNIPLYCNLNTPPIPFNQW